MTERMTIDDVVANIQGIHDEIAAFGLGADLDAATMREWDAACAAYRLCLDIVERFRSQPMTVLGTVKIP